MQYFNNDPDIRHVLMQLINGTYSSGDFNMFRDIYDSLLNTNSSDRADTYFILADFKSYAEAQRESGGGLQRHPQMGEDGPAEHRLLRKVLFRQNDSAVCG